MLHLGSIGGTSIDVDFTFIILVVFFTVTSYDAQLGWAYALLWPPVLFLSVLIHELAHAATIGIFGHGSSHIVLGGMGGMTINERRARPWQDMLISAAGPISSFALAFFMLWLYRNVAYVHQDKMLEAFVPHMYSANLWWGIFNLFPITPLDGGRALRNLLRIFLKENTAFVIAVWIAIVFGAAVAIFALFRQAYMLAAIIGWFTFNNFQQWEDYRHKGFPND